MSTEHSPLDERKRKFWERCREIRAYVAQHPGCTTDELKQHVVFNVSHLRILLKLEALKISGGGSKDRTRRLHVVQLRQIKPAVQVKQEKYDPNRVYQRPKRGR